MTGISIFAFALALLPGADEVTGLGANGLARFKAPAHQGLIVAARTLQPDDRVSRSEAEKKELEKVTGTWVQAGENVPPENAKARLIYEGREFVGRHGDKVLFRGSVRLDPTQNPKAIDLTLDTGPNKGKISLGVYELEGDSYRGCLAEPGKARPTRLSPEPGSGQQAFAFRRVKDESTISIPAGEKPDTPAIQAELHRFEGSWSYASIVRDGKPVPEDDLKAKRLLLKGDRFTATEPKATHQGKYTVNPIVTPCTIDITFTAGPRIGEMIQGIYELTADTCRVCMRIDGQPRPTSLESKPGSGVILEVLKRENR
jgi:uncharacterized protein (TIGR03067 family)